MYVLVITAATLVSKQSALHLTPQQLITSNTY